MTQYWSNEASNVTTVESLYSDLSTSSITYSYDPRITRPFAIICLFIGSIGNSLSFIVFSQKQLRTHSTFRYLAYLSIVDLIVLYLGLVYLILRDFFQIDIRTQSLFLCKFHTFLTYVTTHLSSWILTIVSIDRAVACTVVQLNKRFCRPKSADRIFLFMCLTVSLINIHILLFMGSERSENVPLIHNINISTTRNVITCSHNTSDLYFQFFEKPYNTIDLLSYVLIPFLIMTICACIIAYRLFFSLSKTTMNKATKGHTRKGTQRAKQISYMLLVLNLVFVLLLSPIVIGQVVQDFDQEHHHRLYNSITLVLSYTNHALNFVLYGIASPQFRLTLRQLLGFKSNDPAQRRLHTFGMATTTAF